MIPHDKWQQFYNLTWGYYFLGCAQYRLGGYAAAAESFAEAFRCDHELCRVDDYSMFNAEKLVMVKYLGEILGGQDEGQGTQQSPAPNPEESRD
jgi:hypothetical protein